MEIDFHSAKFDEAQQKGSRPEQLFHYTTQSGLLGILESGALWVTQIQYLNDSTEFGLALKLALERAVARKTTENNAVCVAMLDSVIGWIKEIKIFNICSVSFCEDSDLLSQWRGYAENSGYSVGFQTDALADKSETIGGHLFRCIYENDIQSQIVDEIITASLSSVVDLNKENNSEEYTNSIIHGIADKVKRSIVKYGVCFKDAKFKEEREWRIIIYAPIIKDFKFRHGKSAIIPYCVLKLVKDIAVDNGVCRTIINGEWAGIIKKIVIGPCPDKERSEQAILWLIIKYFICDGRDTMCTDSHRRLMQYLAHSEIPFRYW
jgi:hypothetical protein